MEDKMGRLWQKADELRHLVQKAVTASSITEFQGGHDALVLLREAAQSHQDKNMTPGKLLRLICSDPTEMHFNGSVTN